MTAPRARLDWRRVALAAAGLALVVVALIVLPVDRAATTAASWLRAAGVPGVLAFAAAYVVGAVLVLPAWVFTVCAGFAYGPVLGLVVAVAAGVPAATAAFGAGRWLARAAVAERAASSPRLAALDDALGREGFTVVMLLRLSPVMPTNLLNYALGASQVPARAYVLGTLVGMLPVTAAYVLVGSLAPSAGQLVSARPSGQMSPVFTWAGIVATVVVTVILGRMARGALRRAIHRGDRQP